MTYSKKIVAWDILLHFWNPKQWSHPFRWGHEYFCEEARIETWHVEFAEFNSAFAKSEELLYEKLLSRVISNYNAMS